MVVKQLALVQGLLLVLVRGLLLVLVQGQV
jgi:hypothetical protein